MEDEEGYSLEVFLYRGKGGIPRNAVLVEVHRSVEFIPDRLFHGCDRLESVLLHEGLLRIGNLAFLHCSSLRSIRLPSVTELGNGAFMFCTNLAEVHLPEGLRSIEGGTFYGCASLEGADVPASVARIGGRAFLGCTSLASVGLREGLRTIGYRTFNGCQSLESLRIPSSVDEIGQWAFDGCSGLASVWLHERLPMLGRRAFGGCAPQSFRFVRLSERREAIGMDERTASMFESRLNDIANAMTGYHGNRGLWAAGAILEKCKKSLERAHEFLTYLELKGAMPVLELAVWKAKIEDEPGDDRLLGDNAADEDGGKDARDAVRVRQRRGDPQLSRRDCRVKCGADIVSAEVRRFFACSASWPRLDVPE